MPGKYGWLKYSRAERDRYQRALAAEAEREALRAEADLEYQAAKAKDPPDPGAVIDAFNRRADMRARLVGTYAMPSPPVPRWRVREGGRATRLRWWATAGRVFLIIVLPILLIILGLITGIRQLSWYYAHKACPREAAALGVEYKWADYHYFGWDCLADVQGRWVPIGTVNNDTGVWLRPAR